LAAAYSRSEEDLIQRVPDSLGGAHSAVGDAGMGRVSLPAAALRNLVRERLREEGISLSSHPYTQSVGLQYNPSLRQNVRLTFPLVASFRVPVLVPCILFLERYRTVEKIDKQKIELV
jgi:hypothetical protein